MGYEMLAEDTFVYNVDKTSMEEAINYANEGIYSDFFRSINTLTIGQVKFINQWN